MKLIERVSKCYPLVVQVRNLQCVSCPPCPPVAACKPRHLICFKQWTANMVMDIIVSAMNLKNMHRNTHEMRLDTLTNAKVMILEEVNQPHLSMAVSKAATLLGAYDVSITDKVVWDHDYMGRIFSTMADVIFVSTATHMCIQRFADQSSVPVLCMSSRTHASIQSLATVMSIIEEFGSMGCLNVSWLGRPHPVLNSYLLLCPMLGANIKFKCCCPKCPVSPLLMKSSEEMTEKASTTSKECRTQDEVLHNANVVIAGPTTSKKEKIQEFKLTVELEGTLREIQASARAAVRSKVGKCSVLIPGLLYGLFQDICRSTCSHWIFFHTCPRGPEANDGLFYHCNSRTFNAYENMHYIAAALMAYTVKGYCFY